MDRGAWQATIHGVTRVRHDLATIPHHHHHLFYQECYWKSDKQRENDSRGNLGLHKGIVSEITLHG